MYSKPEPRYITIAYFTSLFHVSMYLFIFLYHFHFGTLIRYLFLVNQTLTDWIHVSFNFHQLQILLKYSNHQHCMWFIQRLQMWYSYSVKLWFVNNLLQINDCNCAVTMNKLGYVSDIKFSWSGPAAPGWVLHLVSLIFLLLLGSAAGRCRVIARQMSL